LFAQRLQSAAAAVPQMMVAYSFAIARPMEIVLAGPREDASMQSMLAAIHRHFLPNAVVMMAGEAPHPMPALGGEATAYVCENYACQLPTTDVAALEQQLSSR
jgi:hypothetical protein